MLASDAPVGDTLYYTIEDIPERARFHVAIFAIDEYGNRSPGAIIDGQTLDNSAPARRPGASFQLYFERIVDRVIDLDDYFLDPDGDALVHAATSSDVSVLVATLVDGHRLNLHPVANGACSVWLVATDGHGASARVELMVMIRETGLEVEFYPNPVTALLHARMGREVDGFKNIRLYNALGARVLSTSILVRQFAPGTLDLSSFATGSYIIVLEHEGKEFKQAIVKR